MSLCACLARVIVVCVCVCVCVYVVPSSCYWGTLYRSWFPTSSNAYLELELDDLDTPVGLVVVTIPHINVMSPDTATWGGRMAVPYFQQFQDNDYRQAWFYGPPGEDVGWTWGYRYGMHGNLSAQMDEWGYPDWCEANAAWDDLYDHGQFNKKYRVPCYMTPTSPEYGERKSYPEWGLAMHRWWGTTGGRPGRGAVISVSDMSCADERSGGCGSEPGALGAEETVCKVVTEPSTCAFDKYSHDANMYPSGAAGECPIEVDCGGAAARFVRVRLPGPDRAVFLDPSEGLRAYRTAPKGVRLGSQSPKESPVHELACYGIETFDPPDANSEEFLEKLKQLDYSISLDPQDPIFYSTCLIFDQVTEWLPLSSEGGSSSASQRPWNFSGHCLDCDSFKQNYIDRPNVTDAASFMSPQVRPIPVASSSISRALSRCLRGA